LARLFSEGFRISSEIEFGLELADIVVNTARRAITGSLQREGWRDLPRLMIHRNQCYIRFNELFQRPITLPKYIEVLAYFRRGGRDILPPRLVG
jgi:hypothetical protein